MSSKSDHGAPAGDESVDWRHAYMELEPILCDLKDMGLVLDMLADHSLMCKPDPGSKMLSKEEFDALYFATTRIGHMATAAVKTYYELFEKAEASDE
jgi:hypothetical protein